MNSGHVRTLPVQVLATSRDAELALAAEIAERVRADGDAGRPTVLGLATGRTPIGTYAELVRLHREEGLDLSGVTTFNLDEFHPIPPDHPHSFRAFMNTHLFDHVNVEPDRVHFLRGDVPDGEVEAHCAAFEEAIRDAGGIGLQVLGLGLNGHVGFNEPGSARDSRTRRIALDGVTRRSYEASVGETAPEHALTMGIATILEARSLRILALGEHKASIVARLLEERADPGLPASLLQEHGDVRLLLDRGAAGERA